MLIDIGANLTHDSFDHDRDEVLQRATDKGVQHMVVTGASRQGSHDALTLATQNANLSCTVGIHPHHAEETDTGVIAELTELAGHSKVVAIGETGLDFFRDFSPSEQQIHSFEEHIELAKKLKMPMFLHERDAYPTFAEVLTPHRDELTEIVVHCFTGERQALDHYLDLDCYIGITGWICDERRGQHLLDLIKHIPLDRLMIETDAPYLLPRHVRPKPKTRRNEPHYLQDICEFIAAQLNMTYEELARQTTHNAKRFFRLQ